MGARDTVGARDVLAGAMVAGRAYRDEPCHGCFGRGTIGNTLRPCAVCYDAEGECSTGRILSNLEAQDAPPFTRLILALGAAAYHVGLRGLAYLWGHPE